MADHPYQGRADYAYWRRAVGSAPDGDLDPFTGPAFPIGKRTRVVAAGSCFAQHIGRYLNAVGRPCLVTEPPHPILTAQAAHLTNYGVYAARYGNIYTARQLLQLLDRAYGRLHPEEDIWRDGDRVFIDPFRPNIQPDGFNSELEFTIDRQRHFQAVREAFERLDIFIFTLGLTEAWRSRRDGAVFPVCPGVSGGQFSPERHEFVNFGVNDVVADLRAFIGRLRDVNRTARVILTVSPVPLAATAEDRHVLVSTMYSKSVLRVACDVLVNSVNDVVYFPAYEIVASGHAGRYFAADRRSATPEGVAHVMRVFARHFLPDAADEDRSLGGLVRRAFRPAGGDAAGARTLQAEAMQEVFQIMCDEEALDRPFDAPVSAETPRQPE